VLGSGLAVIEGYADGLAARLRGPRRMRTDMVTEARDSLLDAAEAHVEAGLSPAEAARTAVAEFGTYRQVVPGYQAELAAAQGRRTVLWMATVLPVMHLLAPLMWWQAPWSNAPASATYWSLTSNYDYLSLGASVVALVLFVGFGWGSRFLGDHVGFARWVGIGSLGFLALHGATGTAVFVLSMLQWPTAATWPPILIGCTANGMAFAYAIVMAWRCVRACNQARNPAAG
jgi:hypothetical protein